MISDSKLFRRFFSVVLLIIAVMFIATYMYAVPLIQKEVYEIERNSTRLTTKQDDFRREGLAIKAGFSLPSIRVIRSLNQLIEWRDKSLVIRCDNGPEFISHELTDWALKNGISIEYIQSGKPQQNAYIKRHNRTTRYS